MESVPKYIKALRKKIGNQLIVSPTVGVIITDKEERILLLESTDPNSPDTDLGHWTIPGGFIEPEEQPADTAIRETFEETGLVIEIRRLIGVYGGSEFSVLYKNGDEVSTVGIVFAAIIQSATKNIEVGNSYIRYKFFSQKQISKISTPNWLKNILRDVNEIDISYAQPKMINF